jgi:hypothetical protein
MAPHRSTRNRNLPSPRSKLPHEERFSRPSRAGAIENFDRADALLWGRVIYEIMEAGWRQRPGTTDPELGLLYQAPNTSQSGYFRSVAPPVREARRPAHETPPRRRLSWHSELVPSWRLNVTPKRRSSSGSIEAR